MKKITLSPLFWMLVWSLGNAQSSVEPFEKSTQSEKILQTIDSIRLPAEYLLPESIVALSAGFAHNDYLHENPLSSALQNGFVYIEVDIHLIEEELYVSHKHPASLDPERTLKRLYLEPLKQIYEANDQRFYANYSAPIVLSVDIKTEAIPTYIQLKSQLKPYHDLLTKWNKGTMEEGPIQILISGNRPIESMRKETFRIAFVDGRLEDIGQQVPTDLMLVISDNFTHVFGKKEKAADFNQEEIEQLRQMVNAIHQEGKKLRFWKTAEYPDLWAFLLNEGVDIINTDELEAFRMFYWDHQKTK